MGTPSNDGVGGAIVKLARELGMGLIAEGVETARTPSSCIALDCPHAQGYLFSEPLTAQRHRRRCWPTSSAPALATPRP